MVASRRVDDLAFESATSLARRVREREVSSRELVDLYLARIERLNGPLNAVVTLDADGARARARKLDERLARGEVVGPLHGVPMTIKDAFETAGIRTTGGAVEWRDHVPSDNATAVQRLIDAGAVVFGKTNVPAYSSDLQTYNDVFGTTHNPHDMTRAPGGSSGGAAVALAAGFTGLELGSDIGGSIRTPSHWTGIYGHKPSHGLVPTRGHIPPRPGSRGDRDLNVIGPLARAPEDLALALDVVAGPDAARGKAWRLALPPPRAERLERYRVAAWLDDATYPVDAGVRRRLESVVAALRAAGVQVDTDARPGMTLAETFETYWTLLNPIIVSDMPKPVQDMLTEIARTSAPDDTNAYAVTARNATQRHLDWLATDERRAGFRARWAEFFERFDVLLMPVNSIPALVHDHSEPLLARTIQVNGETRAYGDLFGWIAPATLNFLPATVAPAGRTESGLPVGVQIVGPYLEDRTTLDFATRLRTVASGFERPKGY